MHTEADALCPNAPLCKEALIVNHIIMWQIFHSFLQICCSVYQRTGCCQQHSYIKMFSHMIIDVVKKVRAGRCPELPFQTYTTHQGIVQVRCTEDATVGLSEGEHLEHASSPTGHKQYSLFSTHPSSYMIETSSTHPVLLTATGCIHTWLRR